MNKQTSPPTKNEIAIQQHDDNIVARQATIPENRNRILTAAANDKAIIAANDLSNVREIVRAKLALPVYDEMLRDHAPDKDHARKESIGTAYVIEHPEIVPLLETTLAERTKSKTTALEAIGKAAAAITARIFSAPTPDEAARLTAEREAEEQKAEDLKASIAAAELSIRMLAVSPSLATFRAAAARVSEISMIGSAGSSAA